MKLQKIPLYVGHKELPYFNADRGKLSYMERRLKV
jgi:hypothetical protein